MKKSIVAGVSLVLIACIVAPGLVGRVAERQIRDTFAGDRLAQNFGLTDSGWVVAIRSYERGWFRSHGQLAVGLDGELLAELERDASASENGTAIADLLGKVGAQSGDVVIFDVDIQHGPLLLGHSPAWGLFAATAHPDEESPIAEALRQRFGVERFVGIRLHGGFSRDVSVHIELPAIAFAENGVAIEFSGSHLNGYFHPSPQRVDISTQTASLDVTMAGARVSIRDVQAHSHYASPVADVWIGDSRMELARFGVYGEAPEERVEVEKLGVHSRTAFADDETHVDFENTLALDKLLLGGVDEITEGTMEFAVRRVPQEVLRSYREFAGEMPVLGRAPSEEQEARIRELFGELLGAAPRIEVGPIEFLTQKGKFRGWVNASVDRERMPAKLRLSAATALPLLLMAGHVEGQISATEELVGWMLTPILRNQLRSAANAAAQEISQEEIDAMVADRVRAMIANALSSGILRGLEGNRLESAIDFAQGKLTVNGTVIPLVR